MVPPPPPVTPSPHRFVTPKQQDSQPKSVAGSAAVGRQFNKTPRFNIHSSTPTTTATATSLKSETGARNAYMFSSPLVARGMKRVAGPEEDVIEMSSDREEDCGGGEGEEEEEGGEEGKGEVDLEGEGDVELREDEGGRKRRKISGVGGSGGYIEDNDSPPSILRHPTAPRFIFPLPPPSPPPAQNTNPITAYAHALLPPQQPPSSSSSSSDLALAQLLSPQHRAPKHTPGGLAAEVSAWIMGARIPHSNAQDGGGATAGERVKVLDAREGDGIVLVKGKMGGEEGDEEGGEKGASVINILLTCSRESMAGGPVIKGSTIRLKDPAWEISVRGAKWKVAVDWRLADPPPPPPPPPPPEP